MKALKMSEGDTHQPKGGLCANCVNAPRSCDHLDFSSMKVVGVYPDGVKAVKCTDYERKAA